MHIIVGREERKQFIHAPRALQDVLISICNKQDITQLERETTRSRSRDTFLLAFSIDISLSFNDTMLSILEMCYPLQVISRAIDTNLKQVSPKIMTP